MKIKRNSQNLARLHFFNLSELRRERLTISASPQILLGFLLPTLDWRRKLLNSKIAATLVEIPRNDHCQFQAYLMMGKGNNDDD